MSRSVPSFCRSRLSRDERGATIVEFALLSPVLLGLIFGAIDLGYLYMAQSALNGAVAHAARKSAASMEKSEDDRDTAMRSAISTSMRAFSQTAPTITTTVYSNFAATTPEPYIDANGNGVYDPPAGADPGEAFTDRNGNGQWDAAVPSSGAKTRLGDLGDIVTYSASLPVQHLFPIVFGNVQTVTVKSTFSVRNEAAKTE